MWLLIKVIKINFAENSKGMEVKQRIANIIKFLSMAALIGSLLFMYAYGSDAHSTRVPEQGWLAGLSKTTIFYTGLIVFGMLNVIFNWWIKMFRETSGFDPKSFLFKNEYRKSILLVWFTLLLAAVNFFISTVITYIAFIKIDGVSAEIRYFFLPVAGLSVFVLVAVGGVVLVLRKTQA